jgi:hypothetical protein
MTVAVYLFIVVTIVYTFIDKSTFVPFLNDSKTKGLERKAS